MKGTGTISSKRQRVCCNVPINMLPARLQKDVEEKCEYKECESGIKMDRNSAEVKINFFITHSVEETQKHVIRHTRYYEKHERI